MKKVETNTRQPNLFNVTLERYVEEIRLTRICFYFFHIIIILLFLF